MQAAEFFDDLMSRAEKEMVGVSEDDLRTELDEFSGCHGLDGSLGSHRHEDWSLHASVRCMQFTGPGTTSLVPMGQLEAQARAHGRINMASP